MLEETHVCPIETLKNFLYRLRMQKVSIYPFCEVSLHPFTADILLVHTVVAFLQFKCMIPYKASLAKHLVKMFRLIGSIQLILVCNHDSKFTCLSCNEFNEKSNRIPSDYFALSNNHDFSYAPSPFRSVGTQKEKPSQTVAVVFDGFLCSMPYGLYSKLSVL